MKRIAMTLVFAACLCAAHAEAHPWKRSYVVDDRLAVLRAGPRLGATVAKRLRPGRMVAIVSRTRDRFGLAWVRVAVTRRTRGWLLEMALASPNDNDGESRLTQLLETADGYDRLRLARLALDHFPRIGTIARSVFREEADTAAIELSRRLAVRADIGGGLSPSTVRALLLSDPLLDRYSRLGVVFDVDVNSRNLIARPLAR